MYYCYRITCLPTGKKYIGVTNDIEVRWARHVARLNSSNRPKWKLYNSMKKYGLENFKIEKILERNTLEEALSEEVRLIQEEDTFLNGLNSTTGGEAGFLMKKTEEAKARIREYCNRPEYLRKLKEVLNLPEVKKKHRDSINSFWKENEEAREISRKAASKKHFLDISLRVKTSEKFWNKGIPGSVCYLLAMEFREPRVIREYLESIDDIRKRSHDRGWLNHMFKKSLIEVT